MSYYKELRVGEFEEAIKSSPSAAIIDVRTPAEFARGHIPGSVNIDVMNDSVFFPSIASLDKSKPYYVYCRSGGRSALACSMMADKGFTAFNLIGGLSVWTGDLAIK
jgi:rhodanese-related sulfurtransferase